MPKKQSIANSLLRFIRKWDSYGVPISLTFDGETTHKTVRGGLLTVFISFYLLYYTIVQFTPVYLNEISLF
jgi:hypothetical protein